MKDIQDLIICLQKSPHILKNLIASIPQQCLKTRRLPGKWSIHEHACHLVAVQPMLIDRLKIFQEQEAPVFKPFIPGKTNPDESLMDFNLTISIDEFFKLREELVKLIKGRQESDWQKYAQHPQYSEYTAYILLRHILMHDHLHMYRIEELWLTTDIYLNGRN